MRRGIKKVVSREYKRNPEAALLIGRYSKGIDHKGRRAGKILRWPL
jgi:hypothetical protein